MDRLLIIDDDTVVIPEQVRQAFPAPRYRVEAAHTGAGGIERVRDKPRTSFSSTCVCPTNPCPYLKCHGGVRSPVRRSAELSALTVHRPKAVTSLSKPAKMAF